MIEFEKAGDKLAVLSNDHQSYDPLQSRTLRLKDCTEMLAQRVSCRCHMMRIMMMHAYRFEISIPTVTDTTDRLGIVVGRLHSQLCKPDHLT